MKYRPKKLPEIPIEEAVPHVFDGEAAAYLEYGKARSSFI